jgi:Cd(II)/Pb(II)-responsive transcriptional regulator
MPIKIGELAKRAHCKVETIRYYEKEGLLPEPTRSQGNYRLYGDAHVERTQFIRHCRSLDMTLGEIRVLLRYRDAPNQDCGKVSMLLDEHIRQLDVRIEELLWLKQHLSVLREQCTGARPALSCGILQGLSNGAGHSNASEDMTPRGRATAC